MRPPVAPIYTVATGPKGGVEFRQWTGPDTFRVVSRFVAWPHLTPEQRADAEVRLGARRERERARAADDAAWRAIMRGGRS